MIYGEPGPAEAQSLTPFRRLLAPTLPRYRMAHIAVRKVALADGEAPRVQKAFAAGLRVPMRPVESSWPTVVELARANGLSAYDASYLQVALALHVRVATLDRRLACAAEALGIMAGSRAE